MDNEKVITIYSFNYNDDIQYFCKFIHTKFDIFFNFSNYGFIFLFFLQETNKFMRIEHDGKIYETVINKPIISGDYYFDCMTHEVKKCKTYICFDPWSLKMEIVKNMDYEKNTLHT